jgi:protein subunit release factor B
MSQPDQDRQEDCYIDIVALHGGDESHVFVDIMLNMYRLWAYESCLTFRSINAASGVGMRLPGRAKLLIEGADRSLLASRENGVHRMIRFPPGRTQRHMSFVGVRVSGSADAVLPEGRDGWGEQIRSLIINPEPSLTNHRTGFVTSDIVGVMSGDLQRFWEER